MKEIGRRKDQLPHLLISKMINERGIPVNKAEFHASVNNSDNTPESHFSLASQSKDRQVKMWWIVGGEGLLCLHKDKYFLVPQATVKYCNFG